MKITEALLAEHIVFHNLFDFVEQTAPRLKTVAEVRSLARLLETVLHAHSDKEDVLMFAPLEHCLEQMGQSEALEEEHHEIEDHLVLAQKTRDLRKARRLLLEAVISSRKHFDKEERLVFPLAERVLKAKTLHDLGKTWLEQRKAVAA
jgi:hemerythrin-like domain-containing protein